MIVASGQYARRKNRGRHRFILGKVGTQQLELKCKYSGSWFGVTWSVLSTLIATWPRFSYALAHGLISQNQSKVFIKWGALGKALIRSHSFQRIPFQAFLILLNA